MAVSSSDKYSIYHFLHQYQLELVDGVLIYIPPIGCKKRNLSKVVNVIPNDRDLFSKLFEEVAYVKSEDQPIKGVVVYEFDVDCDRARKKYKLNKKLYICYGKLKWRRIC